ncbi:hypothetical protein NE683_00670 [Bariatricus massiliensis]|nr:hypothetical protein [Bariatricus massiliensis]MDY2663614.1 hypothetical protein [Bariatricus massiliensis]
MHEIEGIFQQQEGYKDAEKIWEHRVLNGVTEIQTAFVPYYLQRKNTHLSVTVQALKKYLHNLKIEHTGIEWTFYGKSGSNRRGSAAHCECFDFRKQKSI